MKPEILIDVTDAWLKGSSETVAVPIDVLRGSPVFLITPTDEKERERVAVAHGYCPACEGEGVKPIPYGREMRSMPCPKCRGKAKSMADPEVRLALMQLIVHGWEGWTTKEGTEIPYNREIVESIAFRNPAIFGSVVNASQELKTAYREAEEGNSVSGPGPSSGDPTHLSAPSPESGE